MWKKNLNFQKITHSRCVHEKLLMDKPRYNNVCEISYTLFKLVWFRGRETAHVIMWVFWALFETIRGISDEINGKVLVAVNRPHQLMREHFGSDDIHGGQFKFWTIGRDFYRFPFFCFMWYFITSIDFSPYPWPSFNRNAFGDRRDCTLICLHYRRWMTSPTLATVRFYLSRTCDFEFGSRSVIPNECYNVHGINVTNFHQVFRLFIFHCYSGKFHKAFNEGRTVWIHELSRNVLKRKITVISDTSVIVRRYFVIITFVTRL